MIMSRRYLPVFYGSSIKDRDVKTSEICYEVFLQKETAKACLYGRLDWDSL